jgi:hypothetical protein
LKSSVTGSWNISSCTGNNSLVITPVSSSSTNWYSYLGIYTDDKGNRFFVNQDANGKKQ